MYLYFEICDNLQGLRDLTIMKFNSAKNGENV